MVDEAEDDLTEGPGGWRDGMENRGMRVSVGKTKVMISGEWRKVMQGALGWPCGDVVEVLVVIRCSAIEALSLYDMAKNKAKNKY